MPQGDHRIDAPEIRWDS